MTALKQLAHILKDCMIMDDNIPKDVIKVEAISHEYIFRPDQVKKYADAIGVMLATLPEAFHEGTGDGQSLLYLANQEESLWFPTSHTYMLFLEALICLGIAAGKAKWYLPKNMWHTLPGGMPYLTVLKKG